MSKFSNSLAIARSIHTTPQALATGTFQLSHQKISSPPNTKNFLDGKLVESEATEWLDLCDPATNHLVTRVPLSTDAELKAAVDSAEKAFPGWKRAGYLARQQVMFRLVSLIRRDWDRLAASITLEQGKTFEDAKGDVLRGLQVAEVRWGSASCSKANIVTGRQLVA